MPAKAFTKCKLDTFSVALPDLLACPVFRALPISDQTQRVLTLLCETFEIPATGSWYDERDRMRMSKYRQRKRESGVKAT